MRTTRRVLILLASGAHAYHQSEFVELWEQVPQTCINVRAGDTTRDSTAKEMPSWSGYGDVSYRCENDPPQVEFDLHPDERIEIDDDDDVLRRELGI